MTAQALQRVNVTTETGDAIYRIAAGAALINVVLIAIQIVVYAISPPPSEVTAWYALLQTQPVLGLMNLDLLLLVNIVLLIPIYLALFLVLQEQSLSVSLLAMIVGLVGLAGYFSSNTALEMLRLSGDYAAATGERRLVLESAGEALVVKYFGTAFVSYYLMNALPLLLFGWVMRDSDAFGNWTLYTLLASGVLMLIPPAFGTVGMVFSFSSLFPWVIFSVLVARDFWRMGHQG